MKGFGKNTTQNLLIKGWLIPGNRKYYKFKQKLFMLESLPMLLNMWVALASHRLKFEKNAEEISMNSLTLIGCLDDKLTQRTYDNANRWMAKLKSDDQFYVEYCQELLEIVKNKIAKGEHSDLNSTIQNTWEYKRWMLDAGHLLTTLNLIDGWLHPLADSEVVNEESLLNVWLLASMIVGSATGRSQEGDKDKSIQHLIKLNVLDVETNFDLRLQVAKHLDAEYLTLISETKEALQKSIK